MSRRKNNFNPLERERATQNIPSLPRKVQALEGFRVLDGARVWEEEQMIDGEIVKVKLKVQSLSLDRASDQGALEPGDARDNYDSETVLNYESDYNPGRPGEQYTIRRRG